jgi:hypothetical protein
MAEDTMPERGFFEKHADKIAFGAPDDCWLWTASASGNGYGQVRARGTMRQAHREAYEAVHGPGSAAGFVVRHRCDTPACVNPAHLATGTHADNTRDKMERGRHRCGALRGSTNGRSKLTDADVVAIRAEYVRGSGEHGQDALARRYGVSRPVVSMIVRHECWRHVG